MTRRAARYVVGFLLLGILLARANFSNVFFLFQQMCWIDAILGFLAFFATGLLDMWRLRLASAQARMVGFWQFIRIHFESYVVAQLLPGQMGMDVYRVGMIGKAGGGYLQSAAILLLLRAFSMVAMFFILMAAVFLFPERNYLRASDIEIINSPAWVILICTLVVLFGLWLVARLICRFLPRTLQARIRNLILVCKEMPADLLALLILVSLCVIAARIVTFYFTLRAMGVDMDLVYTVSVALAASFAWLLPISPGGIGIREGIIVALLARAEVGFDQALLVALLNRIYFTLLAVSGGLLLLLPKTHAVRDGQ